MNLSSREWGLVGATLIAVLIGGTFWLGEPMWKDLQNRRDARSTLQDRKKIAEYLLNQQSEIEARWEALRSRMPIYPLDQDVTSQLLKDLQRNADQYNIALLRVEPGDEESVGDLYELSIQCSWEGTLKALVQFLYKVQEDSGMVDTRSLTITPGRQSRSALKGTIVVDYAYSRQRSVPASETQASEEGPVEINLGD
jgi:Tfp pilus assembly protein PilO